MSLIINVHISWKGRGNCWYEEHTSSKSHFILMLLHLWNYEITGISQSHLYKYPGPLQVSAVLYNTKTVCHQKHNYSSFPAIKKVNIENSIQVTGLCLCRTHYRDGVHQHRYLQERVKSKINDFIGKKEQKLQRKSTQAAFRLYRDKEMEAHLVNRVNMKKPHQLKYTLKK